MIIKNTPDQSLTRATALNSIAIFVLAACFSFAHLCGCAHASSYESELSRQIAAARTAATLFELAVSQAEASCATKPVDACASLPDARKALDRVKQAIVLADANKGAIADALTAIEQLAEVVDMARGGVSE